MGRRVGLTTPAIKQRVLRLEETAIITGYHSEVNPRLAGYPVSAFIRITVTGDERTAERLAATAAEMPDVTYCQQYTGDYAFSLKVEANSVATWKG